MLFNSLEFILLFFPLSLLGYFFLIKKRLILGAKWWILGSSLFFYSYWNIKYLPLLIISISLNFIIGKGILLKKHKKVLLIFGIILNILILGYFKYTDFFIENFNTLFNFDINSLNIVLPLAISFFTFQQIAYLVDIFKGYSVSGGFLDYCLFVSFFPQLIAGPIVSHKEMIPQFSNLKNLCINYKHIFLGISLFLIGLIKKVLIADTFARYATLGFDSIENLTLIGGWITSFAYTFQIYFDFSGYCDMAMGIAWCFNIRLPINFNSPYKAVNIQDFWRRWHITLSRFLRDYLYIPFGGNRKGEARAIINIILVFLIGGLWHGAAWTFVFWGLLHGLANAAYRLWKKTNIHLNKILACFITFNFINITWIFFRATSFPSAFKVLKSMFSLQSLLDLPAFKSRYYLAGFGIHSNVLILPILVIIGVFILPNSIEIIHWLEKKCHLNTVFSGILLGLITFSLLLKILIIPYSEFIYFNF